MYAQNPTFSRKAKGPGWIQTIVTSLGIGIILIIMAIDSPTPKVHEELYTRLVCDDVHGDLMCERHWFTRDITDNEEGR